LVLIYKIVDNIPYGRHSRIVTTSHGTLPDLANIFILSESESFKPTLMYFCFIFCVVSRDLFVETPTFSSLSFTIKDLDLDYNFSLNHLLSETRQKPQFSFSHHFRFQISFFSLKEKECDRQYSDNT
jgi:hypothetical protein